MVSTLDLVGPHFLLLAGRTGDAWIEQLQSVDDVPLMAYRLGGDLVDLGGDVHAALEIDDDGCILVRPDGHVAVRIRSIDSAMSGALTAALHDVLGRTVRAVG